MSRESKLKPIFDCIDNACYKRALTEIDKLLKKNKDVEYLKSLKALCLVRNDKLKEGEAVLDELCQTPIIDEAVLQAMTMAFLDLEQYERIAQIYEAALKSDPGSEKFYTHLFMSYVRTQDYNKQKFTALNLYKHYPKNPYYFWAIMSIYMQALEMENQDMATKIILPLAEKMCRKIHDEHRFESEAEVELFLMILEKQNKLSEMIELIDSDVGKTKLKDYLGFISCRKVGLLKKEKRFQEAFNVLMKLIEDHIDNYDYYIDAFELIKQLDGDIAADMLQNLWNIILKNSSPPKIDSLSENYYRGRKSRGPLMVQIILSYRMLNDPKDFDKFLQNNKDILDQNYLENLLIEFFESFSNKTVCFKDFYFIFKNCQFKDDFIQSFLLKIQMNVLKLEPDNLDNIQRYITYLYLKFSVTKDVEENAKFLQENKKQLFEKHLKVYELLKMNKLEKDILDGQKEIPLDKVELNKKEQCPFDSIIHLLMLYFTNGIDLYRDDRIENMALDLISFLEMALKKNNMDFYSKLFLVRLYAVLGAGPICFQLFLSLEVKHVLLDSLGFQFMQPILSSGCFAFARKLITQMGNLYRADKHEQTEYVISCYKCGSFGKIAELRAFFEKLQNSIQHHLYFAERFSVFLLTDCKDDQHFHNLMKESLKIRNKFKWNFSLESTTDNRDLSIYTTSLSLVPYIDEIKEQSKNIEFRHVQYRIEFLQCVLTTYYLMQKFCFDNGFLEKEPESGFVVYDDINIDLQQNSFKNLDKKFEDSKQYIKEHPIKYYFQGPPPSRLSLYVDSCHHRILVSVLEYLGNILKYFYHKDASVKFEINTKSLLEQFQNELKSFQAKQTFHSLRKFIEYSALSLETISFLLLFVEIISSALSVMKRGKKFKKLSANQSGDKLSSYESEVANIAVNCKILGDFVSELFTVLREAYKNFDDHYFDWILNKDLQTFNDFQEIVDNCKNVKTQLIESYKNLLNNQVTRLDFKHKYLKQLPIYKN